MRLQMRITPLRARTSEPVDEPRLFPCPADLEPDQIRSFLVQFFGEEPIEVAWTKTERHERINLGWIFAALPGGEPIEVVELLCVPVIDSDEGSPKPLFEVLADQRGPKAPHSKWRHRQAHDRRGAAARVSTAR